MKWELDRAWDWHRNRPWLCGFNYVPSTALNTTEFWQADSFDLAAIDRELGWAGAVGLNTCRVFTQYLVWEADPDGFLARLGQFLDIADRRGLSVMVCLFDDCAFSGKQPYLGRQDDPIPGVHNSGWTPSPGHARVVDRAAWPALERYVTGVVSRFAGDARVVAWDLYNEPGNSDLRVHSQPLLERAFEWARGCGPSQPLTVGIWTPELPELNECALQESDIVSFHNYGDLDSMARQIAALRLHGRPVVCTEWMRRTGGSRFSTHLPLFKSEGVGCYFWGLVNGRTQTHFPWGSPAGAPEPETWFHDLLHADGRPYCDDEIALLKKSAGFPLPSMA